MNTCLRVMERRHNTPFVMREMLQYCQATITEYKETDLSICMPETQD